MRRLVAFAVALCCSAVFSADWPQFRGDAAHSGGSPADLPAELHLQWVRQCPPLKPAWPEAINRERMQFDRNYEPVVVGKRLFIGSSLNDSLVCLDTDTGAERWRFFADGPIRLAPVADAERVYFVSDDGNLYALNAETGQPAWVFRGAPAEKRLLGNERLIGMWPARGGPVLAEGKIYFAAGIWPFMGVFIRALDARTGKVLWENDSTGSTYMLQPHRSPAFAGLAPQGALAINGDKLLVPCGRAVPGCLELATGKLVHFKLADNGKQGGSEVAGAGKHFFSGKDLIVNDDGKFIISVGARPVVAGTVVYSSRDAKLRACDLIALRQVPAKQPDPKTKTTPMVWELPSLWEAEIDAGNDLIKAGKRLYGANAKTVFSIALPPEAKAPAVAWSSEVSGTPVRLVAADDKLFVVTAEGGIHCFGAKKGEPARLKAPDSPAAAADDWSAKARTILQKSAVSEGYCVALGAGTGRLAEELARQSKLSVIVLEPDLAKVDALRRKFDAAGLYGSRISLIPRDVAGANLPLYLASLIVSEDAAFKLDRAAAQKLFESLRPYGGTACLELRDKDPLSAAANALKLKVAAAEPFSLFIREGGLPNTGQWTHQYGDAANTVVSRDELVKPPLGPLWFGGSEHDYVLPRHGHGPPEQIVDGRLFIEGPKGLSARDVYTGRVLWNVEIPGLGAHYDTTDHHPGANAIGTNFVVTSDKIYVAANENCLVLDPVTGRELTKFPYPGEPDELKKWLHLRVDGDLLLAGAGLIVIKPELNKTFGELEAIASRRLIGLDRHTGKQLWTLASELGFRHNAIALSGQKLFCIDNLPAKTIEKLKLTGRDAGPTTTGKTPALIALDARTGKVLWRNTAVVPGTWLSYSAEHDVLLQAGRPSRDHWDAELQERLIAHRGRDGSVIWDSPKTKYGGPCMLHGDTIITQGNAFELLTGKPKQRQHPLTGQSLPWSFSRHYGCNTAIASTHMILFRSAAAGFFDLTHDGGTGNFGGFRSGCTSNLIAACGVLNAPDYTRTCTCSYQIQTSLALVHMPDAEMWTFLQAKAEAASVKRVGINLGAPGDRRAGDGTYWLEFPVCGGDSPEIGVEVKGGEHYYHHSSRFGGELNWVASSGCKGLDQLVVKTLNAAPVKYRVRLVFAEPDEVPAGQRVFSVKLQGKPVLKDFDIAREAGGSRKTVIKVFENIECGEALNVEFERAPASKEPPLICGLELIVQ